MQSVATLNEKEKILIACQRIENQFLEFKGADEYPESTGDEQIVIQRESKRTRMSMSSPVTGTMVYLQDTSDDFEKSEFRYRVMSSWALTPSRA